MNSKSKNRICIVPRLSGVGGMVTFQNKFIRELGKRDIGFTQDLKDEPYSSVLVIGGTRQIPALLRIRSRNVPIVHRLDGMNWLHRLDEKPVNDLSKIKHYLRSEYGNMILSLIRSRIATTIVYQSEFVRGWWDRVKGRVKVPGPVIHNGVDLNLYKPIPEIKPPDQMIRILMVEGSLAGGYEKGLISAVGMMQRLADKREEFTSPALELMVVGKLQTSLRSDFTDQYASGMNSQKFAINWKGIQPINDIPYLYNQAHMLFSSDINPACPNSVIESLACGLPVLAFDTGALNEIVDANSGKIVPYGADVWSRDQPDIDSLADGAVEIIDHLAELRNGSRQRAVQGFGIDKMMDQYLQVLI